MYEPVDQLLVPGDAVALAAVAQVFQQLPLPVVNVADVQLADLAQQFYEALLLADFRRLQSGQFPVRSGLSLGGCCHPEAAPEVCGEERWNGRDGLGARRRPPQLRRQQFPHSRQRSRSCSLRYSAWPLFVGEADG